MQVKLYARIVNGIISDTMYPFEMEVNSIRPQHLDKTWVACYEIKMNYLSLDKAGKIKLRYRT